MEINEKIDEIIQQAKEEGAYIEDFDAFEQEIYDQGFRNAISFMLWIQASEVVLIVCIRTVESYVGKITVGQNTGAQNWSSKYGYRRYN